MKDIRTRSKNSQEKRNKINWWKWACITLVILIVSGVLYLSSLIQPVTVNEPSGDRIEQSGEEVVLSTSMNKQDTELVMNAYLNQTTGEDFKGYTIRLTNRLEVDGEIEVFGFNVPFSLHFMPYVLESGNIQLKGESVQLANFSLPVSSVMSLFTRQVNLPDFIAVDSESQLIVINLYELTEDFAFDIRVDTIDLENDEIQLSLFLNKDMITDNIQSFN